MKKIRCYAAALSFAITLSIIAAGQSTSVTDRTPEQEAAKQTEKLQKELDLTPDQVKHVYDINLKYARERKQSNKRTDAVTRIKKKNEEISRVLSVKQNDELQSRRTRVQSVEIDGERRYTRTNVSGTNSFSGAGRSVTPSQLQSQDRPVRPDRNAGSQLPDARRTVNPGSTDRPVRGSESRAVRPETSNRRSNQSGDIRPATSGRNSSRGTFERAPQRQSSSPSRESSRPIRNPDSRR